MLGKNKQTKEKQISEKRIDKYTFKAWLRSFSNGASASVGPSSHPSSDGFDFEQSQNLVFSIPVDHRGTTVYLKGWSRGESVYPPIILIHDLGESISVYSRFAKLLNDAGFNVFGFDLRGHGRSGQILGHVSSFESLISDLLQVVAWIRFQSFRKTPILIGQGLGGLISVYFNRIYPQYVNSTILIAPILQRDIDLTQWRRWIIRGLAQAFPLFRLPPPFVPSFSPRQLAGEAERRRLFHGISANFAKELLDSLNDVEELFQGIQGSCLLILPGPGTGMDFSAIQRMVDSLTGKVKDQITVSYLEGISLQPLTADDTQLNITSDLVVNWLQSFYQTHDATDLIT
jgi:pimeloyl-ACP methyl ester carboxylesterase